MPLDVDKPDMLEAVFDRINKKWGQLDILVHSTCRVRSPNVRPRASNRQWTSPVIRLRAWRSSRLL
jgi:enoyl-[acyl-carrier-protein] reductase (NADH)